MTSLDSFVYTVPSVYFYVYYVFTLCTLFSHNLHESSLHHALLVPLAPFLLIEVTRIFLHTEVRNDFKVTHDHCGTLESPWIFIWSRRLLPGMVPLVCTAICNHFAMCCKIFCTLCVLSTSFVNFESSSSFSLSTFFASRVQVSALVQLIIQMSIQFWKLLYVLSLIAFKACFLRRSYWFFFFFWFKVLISRHVHICKLILKLYNALCK